MKAYGRYELVTARVHGPREPILKLYLQFRSWSRTKSVLTIIHRILRVRILNHTLDLLRGKRFLNFSSARLKSRSLAGGAIVFSTFCLFAVQYTGNKLNQK